MKVIYGKYSIQIVPENDADMDGKTDNSTTIMRGTKTYQKVGTKVEHMALGKVSYPLGQSVNLVYSLLLSPYRVQVKCLIARCKGKTIFGN